MAVSSRVPAAVVSLSVGCVIGSMTVETTATREAAVRQSSLKTNPLKRKTLSYLTVRCVSTFESN